MRSSSANSTNSRRGFLERLFPSRQEKKRRLWETQWSQDDFAPKWADRGMPPEILEAVQTGWLPAQGAVLDIGCGLGEIAAWFAERGYKAVAFDIAESAASKGREMHKHLPSPPEYMALDICAEKPPDRQYNILIDRGCLHQIAPEEMPKYVRNIAAVSAPDARFLLFVKAFRDGRPFGDPAEKARLIEWATRIFAGIFTIEKIAETYMDRQHGKDPAKALPGLVFWLARNPAPASGK
jgi:SAM-dependent methyltransferase